MTRDSWRTFTEYQYSGRTVKRWEEALDLARPTEQEYDAAGRLVRSTIFTPPGSAANTTYAYGPFDTLDQVTDANGNMVLMTYDNLGRYTGILDADITTYAIGYDRFDDNTLLLGSGVHLLFTHDKLSRPLTRTSPVDASYNASWQYDQGIGAIGQLTKSQSARVTKNYGFDPYGRLEEIEWRIDDQPRSMFYSFDEHDRLRLTSYPSSPGLGPMEFENVYDGAGLLTNVRRLGDGFEVWRIADADAAQNILAEKVNGDKVESKYTYHPDQLVKTIQTTSLRGLEQSVEYAYGANGNPAWRKDLLQPAATNLETFAHDTANRLTSAEIGGRRSEWTYDALGNMTHSNESGLNGCEWKYGGVNGPHRLTSILCGTVSFPFVHDTRGNVTTIPAIPGVLRGRTLTYTQGNRVASIASVDGTFTFAYDAEDTRVIKQQTAVGSGRTEYLGREFEERSNGDGSTTNVYYVFAGDRLVMQYAWTFFPFLEFGIGQTEYFHQDRLGSPEVTTNANGDGVVTKLSFDAWGKRRNPDWSSTTAPLPPAVTKVGFTGHLHDDLAFVVDMKGRVYDPVLKRFLSADPFVPTPSYGPSWNRYSYVRNNPVRYTDPSGFQERDTGGEDGIQWETYATWSPWLGNDGSGSIHSPGYMPRAVVPQRNDPGPGKTSPVVHILARAPGVAMTVLAAAGRHQAYVRDRAAILNYELTLTDCDNYQDGSAGACLGTVVFAWLYDELDLLEEALENQYRNGVDITSSSFSAAVNRRFRRMYENGVKAGAWRTVHDAFLRHALGHRVQGIVFYPRWSDRSTGWGRRIYDHFSIDEQGRITAFEANTTPWATMTQRQLDRKLIQVEKDGQLLAEKQVRRVIWIGTDPLPTTGPGGQIRRALEARGIQYWVVPW